MTNRIKGTTTLTGLLGHPIKHSKSPHMHNSSFEKLGLDYVYLAFDVDNGQIKEAVESMRTLNAKGFNVTMPHKGSVMEFLDEISEEAEMIGCVNTVLNENGKLVGHNTDGRGFVRSLEEADVDFKGKKIVMVGAGGAAKAVAIQLAFDGAGEIVLFNRDVEKAKKIIDIINHNIPNCKGRTLGTDEKALKEELKDSSILINCTPLGMKETLDRSIISDIGTLHKDLFVADMIYHPLKTKLLCQAEEVGCRNMNGIDMMLYQGALAFKVWTGQDMPTEYIKETLLT